MLRFIRVKESIGAVYVINRNSRKKTRIFQVLMIPNKGRNAWTWQAALVCNTYPISLK